MKQLVRKATTHVEHRLNHYLHQNQYPRIFQYAKFHAKIKILISRTKNALFGHFLAGIRKSHCVKRNQRSRICLIAQSLVQK